MVKKLIQMTIERDNLQQMWGFSLQEGQDMTLTLKVSTVKAGKITEQNRINIVTAQLNLNMSWC